MSEREGRKRTLWDIAITTGVGVGMLTNVFENTQRLYEMGEKIAPRIQEYIGSIGSGVVEYGLPGVACVGTLALGVLAVKATDKYLLDERVKQKTEL